MDSYEIMEPFRTKYSQDNIGDLLLFVMQKTREVGVHASSIRVMLVHPSSNDPADVALYHAGMRDLSAANARLAEIHGNQPQAQIFITAAYEYEFENEKWLSLEEQHGREAIQYY